jgi:hypothetical protein
MEIPTHLDNVIGNKYNIDIICNWLNKLNTKLLIINGPSGVGKSLISRLVFKKLNYSMIEFNVSDITGLKEFKQNITQLLNCKKNLSLYKTNSNNTKFGIILDDINQLCISDTRYDMFNEFIDILIKNPNHNPIICTCDILSNNKKLKELLKYGTEIKLNTPDKIDLINYLFNFFEKKNIEICDKSINLFICEAQYDIRQLSNIIEFFLIKLKTNIILFNDVILFFKSYKKKKINKSLFDISNNIFHNKINYDLILDYSYENIPLMVYENYLIQLNTKKISNNEILKYSFEVINSISNNEILHNFNDYHILVQSIGTNILFNSLENKKFISKPLNYPSILNKNSQFYKNNKFINNNFNIDNIESISKIINYNIFDKNGDINKAKQILKHYKLNSNDISSLIRFDKFNNENKKITQKIKKTLI